MEEVADGAKAGRDKRQCETAKPQQQPSPTTRHVHCTMILGSLARRKPIPPIRPHPLTKLASRRRRDAARTACSRAVAPFHCSTWRTVSGCPPAQHTAARCSNTFRPLPRHVASGPSTRHSAPHAHHPAQPNGPAAPSKAGEEAEEPKAVSGTHSPSPRASPVGTRPISAPVAHHQPHHPRRLRRRLWPRVQPSGPASPQRLPRPPIRDRPAPPEAVEDAICSTLPRAVDAAAITTPTCHARADTTTTRCELSVLPLLARQPSSSPVLHTKFLAAGGERGCGDEGR